MPSTSCRRVVNASFGDTAISLFVYVHDQAAAGIDSPDFEQLDDLPFGEFQRAHSVTTSRNGPHSSLRPISSPCHFSLYCLSHLNLASLHQRSWYHFSGCSRLANSSAGQINIIMSIEATFTICCVAAF